MEKHVKDDDNTYSVMDHVKCPKDNSEVTHTITYKKATCTRVDDIILNFCCSRDAQCPDCKRDYL